MNICCSINEKFIKPLKVLMCSLAETQSEKIDLYLTYVSLYEEEIQDLKKFSRALNINLHCIPFPEDLFNKFKETLFNKLDIQKPFTIEVFLRLFLHKLLPSELHRVLYLDSDIVVIKDLFDFYHMDFQDKEIIVTPDAVSTDIIPEEHRNKLREQMGFQEGDTYFNAGVLLLNLDRIRNNLDFSDENLLKAIQEKDKGFHDQDVLNYLLKEKKIYLNTWAYNMPAPYLTYNQLCQGMIIHYVGYKPWQTLTPLSFEKADFYKKKEKFVDIIDDLLKEAM